MSEPDLDLIYQIEQVEEEIRDKQKTLLDLQHEYLTALGWEILPLTGAEIFNLKAFTYSKGDEFLLDVDRAMEYEEEGC